MPLLENPNFSRNVFSFAQLHDVHLTITDSGLPRSKAKALEAIGARLWIAEVVKKVDLNRPSADITNASTAESPTRNGQLPLHR